MTGRDSSDVVAERNPYGIMAAWGFLVETPSDGNWTESSRMYAQTTDSRVAATAESVVWTPGVVFRVSTISVLMLLTLVGNISLIAVIASQASLRHKRVSVFLLNLAVGDLMVCLVTMSTEILFVAFGEWVLGAVACKLIVYGQMVTLASTTFLLTVMSVDRFQVRTYCFAIITAPSYA